MRDLYASFLFNKHILVDETPKDATRDAAASFNALFSLANLFGIRIVSGAELANEDLIHVAERNLGWNVPEPFYRGFPYSVRELSPDQLLFDQLTHYAVTYGFGNFSQPGHSLLERFERIAFKENTEPTDFVILPLEEAEAELKSSVAALLSGSRPLSDSQYAVVCEYLKERGFDENFKCASKNTAIRLLLDTRDPECARFLELSDVVKIVEQINFKTYSNKNVRKLNFRNQDRKFVARLIDRFFTLGTSLDVRECYERKAIWSGLLHHVHYRPINDAAKDFVDRMRGKGNESVYSTFERLIAEGKPVEAASELVKGKGTGALLRHLDYVLSRCGQDREKLEGVAKLIRSKNPILLIQLLVHYSSFTGEQKKRIFKFTKFNMLRTHQEKEEEQASRRTFLDKQTLERLLESILDNLREIYRNKLGKVYISDNMRRIAPPIQENASQGGFGTLPTGSRLPIPEGKKLRAFTYWEKVNDIDLSMMGLDDQGNLTEFSWRTMYSKQSGCVTFSGDETSGFNGGSEYFDVDVDEFRKQYPNVKYLVLCDNVFTSGPTFQTCFCKAGYMLRDLLDSGKVYEPKTVKTSFLVNCPSRFAYLFGIDLTRNEFVWLNIAHDSSAAVAGMTSFDLLLRYLTAPPILSLYDLFEMMATEVVSDPFEADVVLTDEEVEFANEPRPAEPASQTKPPENDALLAGLKERLNAGMPDASKTSATRVRADAVVLHSYDMEKISALINGAFEETIKASDAKPTAE